MRSEFAALQSAFDKMPGIGNNAQQFVRVNAGGTALESINNSVARAGLGLGTISTQDANNVALTGGTIKSVSALTTNNAGITGGTISGVSALGTNNVAITGGTISGVSTLASNNASITGGTLNNVTASNSTITTSTLTNPANTTQALADAAPTTWDTSLGAIATWTMGSNRTISAPTNLKSGGHYVLLLTSGGFTPTFNAVFKGVNGGGIPAPAASGMTAYVFESDGTNLYLTSLPIMTSLSASIGGDVALNNVSNFIDGPTVATGSVGTWLVFGTVTVLDSAGAANFSAKLWDGTSAAVDSAFIVIRTASDPAQMTLCGVIVSPVGSPRISVRDNTSTSGLIKQTASGVGKDSTITAVRIG